MICIYRARGKIHRENARPLSDMLYSNGIIRRQHRAGRRIEAVGNRAIQPALS